MGGPKAVVFAFRALGETGQSAACTQGADAVPAARQNLVRVGLMADVPYEFVVWRVKDVMKSHRQFDYTEAGAQVTAGYRNGINGLGPQFIGNLLKVPRIDMAEIGRCPD